MKRLLILILFFVPFVSSAEIQNLGIIQGIWFSDTQFFDGEMIRVYTALQNNSGSDVEGIIEFFDNGESLGEKDFSALDGRIIESWMDTLVVSGEHEFSVEITQVQKDDVDAGLSSVVAQSTFSERIAVVKIDTDGDRISDDVDTDDDNDGFSDSEEQEKGTNPLDENDTPEDETENKESIFSEALVLFENLLSKNNSKEESDISEEANSVPEVKSKEIIDDQSPKFIQELSKEIAIVNSVNSQINTIQKNGRIFFEKEKLKIENSKYPKVEKISDKTDEKESSLDINPDEQESSLKDFMLTFYSWLINILYWLFSVWWFVVLLLFFAIYLLLRIIFRIFSTTN